MPLSNCTRCGSVFSRTSKPICSACIRKEEADFEKAVEWLRDNPSLTVHALSKGTGIHKSHILRWIRQKRIIMADASGLVKCKKCGAPISTGNFCDHCKLELVQDVNEGLKTIRKEQVSEEPIPQRKGMHYGPGERLTGSTA